MKKKLLSVKNEEIKKLLQKGGRAKAKKDFWDLLKRAVAPDVHKLD